MSELLPKQKIAPEFGIRRDVVESTSIVSLGYDDRTLTLEVEFPKGSLYRYKGVKPETVAAMKTAPSIGTFFQAYVRGRYETRKMINGVEHELTATSKGTASAASREMLRNLCVRSGYIGTDRRERFNASLEPLARAMNARPDGGRLPLVDEWMNGLTQEQVSAGIGWLKVGRTP